jgi:translocation and assembly module TamA
MRIVFLLIALPLALFAQSLAVILEGNKAITQRELHDALGIYLPYSMEFWAPNPSLEQSMIIQSVTALKSYYRARGFFEAKVTSNTTKTAITFTIEENDPILVSDIHVNSMINIDRDIKLQPNQPFEQEKFSTSKALIKKRYHDAGYCNSEFNSKAWVDTQEHLAHLLFEVTPNEQCIFGAIMAESTPNIDGNLTLSMLQFESGDTYNLEAIQKSYESLYGQEGISRVIINDTDRNGSQVPIVLGIEETPKPIRFSTGLGVSSDQGLGAQIGIRHRNFLGDLKTLSLDASSTQIRQEVTGVLAVPLGGRYFGSAEAGYRDESFNGYRSQSVYEKLTYRYQDTPTSYAVSMLFDQAKTYESTNELAFPTSNLYIPSPMIELNIDTRDKILEPTKGDWINLKGQGSIYSQISDATYFKTLLSGAHIQSYNDYVLAARLRWGTLRAYEGEVPSNYRFYAGGMQSNRAYQYRELGPKDINGDPLGFSALFEGTLELRLPLYEQLRAVLFTDLTYGSNNYLPDYSQPYWGAGIGLRYVTPIGPIAFDIGVDPNDFGQYAFHFRIGELF